MNSVHLIGNLTRDPELRSLPSGTSVCKMRLAVNTRRKDGEQWVDKANYFDVTAFAGRAENAAQYLSKGSRVGVTGRLESREWEADGSEALRRRDHQRPARLPHPEVRRARVRARSRCRPASAPRKTASPSSDMATRSSRAQGQLTPGPLGDFGVGRGGAVARHRRVAVSLIMRAWPARLPRALVSSPACAL